MSLADPLSDGVLWFGVTAGLMLLLAISLAAMVRLLRRNHPELYQEVGSPRWFWGSDSGGTWKFMRFLFSSRPRKLGDSRIRGLCRVIRPLYVVTLAWVLLPFATVLWFALAGPP